MGDYDCALSVLLIPHCCAGFAHRGGKRAAMADDRCMLFVCSANRLRSPTAEAIFKEHDGLHVRSAGLDESATVPLDRALVAWADRIFVMEQAHRKKLKRRFRDALGETPVIVLGIRDEYEFMQPELIEILQAKVPPFLPRQNERAPPS